MTYTPPWSHSTVFAAFFGRLEQERKRRDLLLERNLYNNPAKLHPPNKGKKASVELRRKLSVSHLGKSGYWKGKHRPLETNAKISQKLMGHHYTHISEAQRAHLSALKKGKPVANFLNFDRSTIRFKRKGTSIEVLMQESLAKRNLTFIANITVEGICNVDAKLLDYPIVILTHGCYWHGCPKCFPTLKRIRGGKSVRERRKYDERTTKKFEKNGIYPIVAWEHEFRKNPDIVGDRLDDILYLYRQLMETEGDQSLIDSYFEAKY